MLGTIHAPQYMLIVKEAWGLCLHVFGFNMAATNSQNEAQKMLTDVNHMIDICANRRGAEMQVNNAFQHELNWRINYG
jgi:hypothetical protein